MIDFANEEKTFKEWIDSNGLHKIKTSKQLNLVLDNTEKFNNPIF